MSPTYSLPMDFFHSQTIENCRFTSRPGTEFGIITVRDPLGAIKAIALKTEGGKREAFLSGTGATFGLALQDLHSKSADATQNYISVNGFELSRAPKKKTKKGSRDSDSDSGSGSAGDSGSDESTFSDSASSIVSSSSSGESSGYESLSDDETVSVDSGLGITKAKKREGRNRRGRKGEAGRKTTRTRRSRSSSSLPPSRPKPRVISAAVKSDDDDEAFPKRGVQHPPARASANLARGAHPTGTRGSRPPPPPPGWMPPGRPDAPQNPPRLTGPVSSSSNSNGFRAPLVLPPVHPGTITTNPANFRQLGLCPPSQHHPLALPAAAQQQPGVGAMGPLYNMFLHIYWPGHGKQRIVVQSRASVKAVKAASTNFVRRSPHSFAGVTTSDSAPSRLLLLRATVRRAAIDGADYDMSTYTGDDLRSLLEHASQTGVPRFDVELGVPPPPPIPAGRGGVIVANSV